MKEITNILAAYHAVDFSKKKAALATVVHVEGSSYRQPGARMLVTDDGKLTGAISGGCLEGDALRRARLVMFEGRPIVVTYDTSDDDDAGLGISLGCNGIIHILIEPIDPGSVDNPIALLQKMRFQRQKAVIVTLFSLTDKRTAPPGTCCLYTSGGCHGDIDPINSYDLEADCEEALRSGESLIKEVDDQLTAFIEFVPPVVSLVIAGAGNDVVPLTEMAQLLGWEVTVVDGRPAYAKPDRFPAGTRVVLSKPANLLEHVSSDKYTFFLLMTHNYQYDLQVLGQLLQVDANYIGVLGPRKKLELMLAEFDTMPEMKNVYGPVGLDIGAESAEEIALAIAAEIKSVIAGRSGASLRNTANAIHTRSIRFLANG